MEPPEEAVALSSTNLNVDPQTLSVIVAEPEVPVSIVPETEIEKPVLCLSLELYGAVEEKNAQTPENETCLTLEAEKPQIPESFETKLEIGTQVPHLIEEKAPKKDLLDSLESGLFSAQDSKSFTIPESKDIIIPELQVAEYPDQPQSEHENEEEFEGQVESQGAGEPTFDLRLTTPFSIVSSWLQETSGIPIINTTGWGAPPLPSGGQLVAAFEDWRPKKQYPPEQVEYLVEGFVLAAFWPVAEGFKHYCLGRMREGQSLITEISGTTKQGVGSKKEKQTPVTKDMQVVLDEMMDLDEPCQDSHETSEPKAQDQQAQLPTYVVTLPRLSNWRANESDLKIPDPSSGTSTLEAADAAPRRSSECRRLKKKLRREPIPRPQSTKKFELKMPIELSMVKFFSKDRERPMSTRRDFPTQEVDNESLERLKPDSNMFDRVRAKKARLKNGKIVLLKETLVEGKHGDSELQHQMVNWKWKQYRHFQDAENAEDDDENQEIPEPKLRKLGRSGTPRRDVLTKKALRVASSSNDIEIFRIKRQGRRIPYIPSHVVDRDVFVKTLADFKKENLELGIPPREDDPEDEDSSVERKRRRKKKNREKKRHRTESGLGKRRRSRSRSRSRHETSASVSPKKNSHDSPVSNYSISVIKTEQTDNKQCIQQPVSDSTRSADTESQKPKLPAENVGPVPPVLPNFFPQFAMGFNPLLASMNLAAMYGLMMQQPQAMNPMAAFTGPLMADQQAMFSQQMSQLNQLSQMNPWKNMYPGPPQPVPAAPNPPKVASPTQSITQTPFFPSPPGPSPLKAAAEPSQQHLAKPSVFSTGSNRISLQNQKAEDIFDKEEKGQLKEETELPSFGRLSHFLEQPVGGSVEESGSRTELGSRREQGLVAERSGKRQVMKDVSDEAPQPLKLDSQESGLSSESPVKLEKVEQREEAVEEEEEEEAEEESSSSASKQEAKSEPLEALDSTAMDLFGLLETSPPTKPLPHTGQYQVAPMRLPPRPSSSSSMRRGCRRTAR